ncbi:MAG: hypothetical protein RLZ98_1162 [Pseudomonadota bacterium]|jgi:dTDP-4-amino-4,6-dideoxygalactose transaminase
MQVPYLDYRIPDDAERAEYLRAVETVMLDGDVILGRAVSEIEERIAGYSGTSFAVGVGSGTDAISLALQAIGVGPGDEVITTALSYIGTANAIAATGATPIFVDVGDNMNVDPEAVEAVIGRRTRAIVPVHLGGQLCDMAAIAAAADRHMVPIIEDAAQSIGASGPDGRKAGSLGAAGAISLNAMKILKSFGEGGMVLTNDQSIRDRIRGLRDNRQADLGGRVIPGRNARLDTLQAAVVLPRFGRLEETITRRRNIAARYREAFAGLVEPPRDVADYRDVYYSYSIATDQRDALQAHLEGRGIGTRIQYSYLLPELPAFAHLRQRAPLDKARSIMQRTLSLPCYERLTDEQIETVIGAVQSFFASKR